MRKIWIKVMCMLLLALQASCGRHTEGLEEAIALAGENGKELEKVLEHYRNDEMKLKAAEFLIANMPGHFVPEKEELAAYEPFYEACDSFRHAYKATERGKWIAAVDSLWDVYQAGGVPAHAKRLPLQKNVTAEGMIAEIELAFRSWQENVWAKDVPFEDFCEYILPFCRGNSFVQDDARRRFYELHKGNYFQTKEKAVTAEADSLLYRYREIDFSSFNGSAIPALSAEALKRMGGGSCEEKGTFNSLLFSALGMPVAVDFVPAWGNRDGSHSWNVMLAESRHHAFDPFWGHSRWEEYNKLYANVGMYDSSGQGEFRAPKVYRKTYSTRLECSLLGRGIAQEDIPPLFLDFKKKDVSADYFEAEDVEVNLTEPAPEGASYAYLCVWGEKGWTPVQFGKIEEGKAKFEKMGRNIVYLPAYYKNGTVLPAAKPFWLNWDGYIKVQDGNSEREDSLVTRNLVVQAYSNRRYLRCMDGATLVNLNEDGTEDTLCTVEGRMGVWREGYITYVWKPIRHLRFYLPSDSIALGELSFYSRSGKVKGAKIVSPLQAVSKKEGVEYLLDNFTSTGFRGRTRTGYVDIDLGAEYEVHTVAIAPYVMSQIDTDSEYELLHWKDNDWKRLDRQKGNGMDLVFKDVPGNTLFRLVQKTQKDKKIRERIFLYKDGWVIWM